MTIWPSWLPPHSHFECLHPLTRRQHSVPWNTRVSGHAPRHDGRIFPGTSLLSSHYHDLDDDYDQYDRSAGRARREGSRRDTFTARKGFLIILTDILLDNRSSTSIREPMQSREKIKVDSYVNFCSDCYLSRSQRFISTTMKNFR